MKNQEIKLRVDSDEKVAFQDAAKVTGIPLSGWIRARLRTAARKDLEDAGLPISFIERLRKQDD